MPSLPRRPLTASQRTTIKKVGRGIKGIARKVFRRRK